MIGAKKARRLIGVCSTLFFLSFCFQECHVLAAFLTPTTAARLNTCLSAFPCADDGKDKSDHKLPHLDEMLISDAWSQLDKEMTAHDETALDVLRDISDSFQQLLDIGESATVDSNPAKKPEQVQRNALSLPKETTPQKEALPKTGSLLPTVDTNTRNGSVASPSPSEKEVLAFMKSNLNSKRMRSQGQKSRDYLASLEQPTSLGASPKVPSKSDYRYSPFRRGAEKMEAKKFATTQNQRDVTLPRGNGTQTAMASSLSSLKNVTINKAFSSSKSDIQSGRISSSASKPVDLSQTAVTPTAAQISASKNAGTTTNSSVFNAQVPSETISSSTTSSKPIGLTQVAVTSFTTRTGTKTRTFYASKSVDANDAMRRNSSSISVNEPINSTKQTNVIVENTKGPDDTIRIKSSNKMQPPVASTRQTNVVMVEKKQAPVVVVENTSKSSPENTMFFASKTSRVLIKPYHVQESFISTTTRNCSAAEPFVEGSSSSVPTSQPKVGQTETSQDDDSAAHNDGSAVKKSPHSSAPSRIVDPDAMKKLSQSALGVGKLAHLIVGSMAKTAQVATSELAATLKSDSGLLFDTEIREDSSNPKTWPDVFKLSRKAVPATSTMQSMDGGRQDATTNNQVAEKSPGDDLANTPKKIPQTNNKQPPRNLTAHFNDTNPVNVITFNESDQLRNVLAQASLIVHPANSSALLLGSSAPFKMINVDAKIEEELQLLDELATQWKNSTAEYFHNLRVTEKTQAEALATSSSSSSSFRDGPHRKVPPKRVPFVGPKHQRRPTQAKRHRRP